MGLGGISIWQLLIILLIVVVLFGTKRLRNIGTDLGSAIRGFRNSMKDGEASEDAQFPADANKPLPPSSSTPATNGTSTTTTPSNQDKV